MMDTKRMRMAMHFLPEPGAEVVGGLLDEVERLQGQRDAMIGVLQEIDNCAAYWNEHEVAIGIPKRVKEVIKQVKKWEPRGGDWTVAIDGWVIVVPSSKSSRLVGREYPSRKEAERAAPVHSKMDRFVNWLVEHHDNFDGQFSLDMSPAGNLRITFWGIPGKPLLDAIESSEVEL